jgi:hypothetical protein
MRFHGQTHKTKEKSYFPEEHVVSLWVPPGWPGRQVEHGTVCATLRRSQTKLNHSYVRTSSSGTMLILTVGFLFFPDLINWSENKPANQQYGRMVGQRKKAKHTTVNGSNIWQHGVRPPALRLFSSSREVVRGAPFVPTFPRTRL